MAKQEVQTTNQITGSKKWWALATVLLTMFFSSMDQTVVSTAMPTVPEVKLKGREYFQSESSREH